MKKLLSGILLLGAAAATALYLFQQKDEETEDLEEELLDDIDEVENLHEDVEFVEVNPTEEIPATEKLINKIKVDQPLEDEGDNFVIPQTTVPSFVSEDEVQEEIEKIQTQIEQLVSTVEDNIEEVEIEEESEDVVDEIEEALKETDNPVQTLEEFFKDSEEEVDNEEDSEVDEDDSTTPKDFFAKVEKHFAELEEEQIEEELETVTVDDMKLADNFFKEPLDNIEEVTNAETTALQLGELDEVEVDGQPLPSDKRYPYLDEKTIDRLTNDVNEALKDIEEGVEVNVLHELLYFDNEFLLVLIRELKRQGYTLVEEADDVVLQVKVLNVDDEILNNVLKVCNRVQSDYSLYKGFKLVV